MACGGIGGEQVNDTEAKRSHRDKKSGGCD
jgi:hypothetical protein